MGFSITYSGSVWAYTSGFPLNKESSVNFLYDPQALLIWTQPHVQPHPLSLSCMTTMLQTTRPPWTDNTSSHLSVFAHVLSVYSCADSFHYCLLITQASVSPSHAEPFQFRVLYYLGFCQCSFSFSNPMRKELGEGQAVSWKYSWCHQPICIRFLSTLTSEEKIINKCVGTSHFSGVRMENFIPKNAKRLLAMRRKLDCTLLPAVWDLEGNGARGEGESSRGQQVRRRLERDCRVQRASRLFRTEGRVKRTLRISSWTATHGVLVSSLKTFLGKQKIGFPGGEGKWRVTGWWLHSFCLDNDRVLEIDSGDNCTTLWIFF